ncbi:hypothetical protein V5085_01820 [Moellerella wisconsensis]|uniref:hypothetical protein n=1 Tax=Moellerella wisconsensis TaxID=158849 RepID=UPI0030767A32
MDIIKKLITGKLSLAITFWGFWFPAAIIPDLIMFSLIRGGVAEHMTVQSVFYLSIFLNAIKLAFCVFAASGIIFMRREKSTIWRVIALDLIIFEFLFFVISNLADVYYTKYIYYQYSPMFQY